MHTGYLRRRFESSGGATVGFLGAAAGARLGF